jgi:hypothetical protein
MVKQHRVLLLAKKAKDSFDERLLLSIIDRARSRSVGGEDGIVHREGDEEQKGHKPNTGHKEPHDPKDTVAVRQA